jgi:hypothetical protein
VGAVRHVKTKYKTLQTGMKIKAKVDDIQNFPKTDVNIIIGFITDTGCDEPLVLCSNGLTLWAEDVIANFTKMRMGTKTWQKTQHVPLDMNKIKIQPGDVFEITGGPYKSDYDYMYFQNKLGDSRCASLGSVLNLAHDYFVFDETFKSYALPHGILPPRMSEKELIVDLQPGLPNFRGMFTQNEKMSEFYPVDSRRIMNV